MIKDSFIKNQDVDIHVLHNESYSNLKLLFVPGMFGIAEHYIGELNHFKEYSAAAISLRGRGKSSAPTGGYTFEHHVSDVVAAADFLGRKNIVLCAHSYGCLIAAGAAIANSSIVSGIILLDKGLSSSKIGEKWLDYMMKHPPENSSVAVAKKIYEASEKIDLISEFKKLDIPMLVFQGTQVGRHLGDEEANLLSNISKVKVIKLEKSGHEPLDSDYKLFLSEVEKFISHLENQRESVK